MTDVQCLSRERFSRSGRCVRESSRVAGVFDVRRLPGDAGDKGGRAVPLPASPTAGYNDSPSIHCPGIASLWRLSETIREIPFLFRARPSGQSPFTCPPPVKGRRGCFQRLKHCHGDTHRRRWEERSSPRFSRGNVTSSRLPPIARFSGDSLTLSTASRRGEESIRWSSQQRSSRIPRVSCCRPFRP